MADTTYLKAALNEIYKRPCKCVSCPDCNGLGNIRVDSFTGQPIGGCDDLYELEPCETCHYGIIDMCERCQEAEEIEQQIDEIEQA